MMGFFFIYHNSIYLRITLITTMSHIKPFTTNNLIHKIKHIIFPFLIIVSVTLSSCSSSNNTGNLKESAASELSLESEENFNESAPHYDDTDNLIPSKDGVIISRYDVHLLERNIVMDSIIPSTLDSVKTDEAKKYFKGELKLKIDTLMYVNEDYRVSVKIRKIDNDKMELHFEEKFSESQVRVSAPIRLTKLVSVKLKPFDNNDFRISNLSSDRQRIDNEYTIWEWQVVPLRHGEKKIKVLVSTIDEYGHPKDISLDYDVMVKSKLRTFYMEPIGDINLINKVESDLDIKISNSRRMVSNDAIVFKSKYPITLYLDSSDDLDIPHTLKISKDELPVVKRKIHFKIDEKESIRVNVINGTTFESMLHFDINQELTPWFTFTRFWSKYWPFVSPIIPLLITPLIVWIRRRYKYNKLKKHVKSYLKRYLENDLTLNEVDWEYDFKNKINIFKEKDSKNRAILDRLVTELPEKPTPISDDIKLLVEEVIERL